MMSHSMKFRAASALVAIGFVLAVSNWSRAPEAAPAWASAAAMFAVMAAALGGSLLGSRRSAQSAITRGAGQVTTGVVFGALIMIIPLAQTLARSYGLIDGAGGARRATGVLTAAFLVMLGNAMPKQLTPLSSMHCDGARHQAFQRIAGWTWVLCGLASMIGWLVLPLAVAELATMVLVVIAIAVTITYMLRQRRPRKDAPAHGVN